ncbi:hypothetical protein NIES267_01800 [Calothrix parasitica NIES-267]|uniref:Uncharacterized protein n=1 Tax=Calothrix parasitica NIES-267 TaxID=1973488 RepID=A0A1Z4LHL8_9CYAN|nr:hypothetical protein NIES267_01800 [Calothrix parasitica NIES-267]
MISDIIFIMGSIYRKNILVTTSHYESILSPKQPATKFLGKFFTLERKTIEVNQK